MKYHRFSSLLLVTLLILPRHGGTRGKKVTNDQKVWYGFHTLGTHGLRGIKRELKSQTMRRTQGEKVIHGIT